MTAAFAILIAYLFVALLQARREAERAHKYWRSHGAIMRLVTENVSLNRKLIAARKEIAVWRNAWKTNTKELPPELTRMLDTEAP